MKPLRRSVALPLLQRAVNALWRLDWLGLALIALVFLVPYWIFAVYVEVVLRAGG